MLLKKWSGIFGDKIAGIVVLMAFFRRYFAAFMPQVTFFVKR